MAKLKNEASGILNWAVQGALKWQAGGLTPPQVVIEQSKKYREESDPLGEFLEECCVVAPTSQVTAKALWDAYHSWIVSNHERPLDRKVFSQKMSSRDFKRVRRGHDRTYTWVGIGLKSNRNLPPDPSPMRADADVNMALLDYKEQIEQRI
jgi:putative DNA primase/helicase